MSIPFTPQEFLNMLQAYSQAIWPAPIVMYALAIVVIILAANTMSYSGRMISGILAAFWMWTGVMFHLTYLREINPGAVVGGILYIVQGALLWHFGVVKQKLQFQIRWDGYGIMGACFAVYAAIIYPFIGILLGHRDFGLLFGSTPCTTIMLTLALFLWTASVIPKQLLIIPSLASLVGFMTAFSIGMTGAIMLPVAGIATVSMLLYRDRVRQTQLTAESAS